MAEQVEELNVLEDGRKMAKVCEGADQHILRLRLRLHMRLRLRLLLLLRFLCLPRALPALSSPRLPAPPPDASTSSAAAAPLRWISAHGARPGAVGCDRNGPDVHGYRPPASRGGGGRGGADRRSYCALKRRTRGGWGRGGRHLESTKYIWLAHKTRADTHCPPHNRCSGRVRAGERPSRENTAVRARPRGCEAGGGQSSAFLGYPGTKKSYIETEDAQNFSM